MPYVFNYTLHLSRVTSQDTWSLRIHDKGAEIWEVALVLLVNPSTNLVKTTILYTFYIYQKITTDRRRTTKEKICKSRLSILFYFIL